MKLLIYKSTLFLFGVLFFMTAGCKEESVRVPDAVMLYNYPLEEGNSFVYRVDSISSEGNTGQIGLRTVTHSGQAVFYNTPYIHRRDTSVIDGLTTVTDLYMRKTNAGVYAYVDTSALAALLPDSLLPLLSVDNEITILSYPLDKARFWPAYKIIVDFVVQVIALVDFNGSYLHEELVSLNINGSDITVTAKKIQYDLSLSIPDAEGEITKTSYRAFGWFVNGIGMVKLKGSNTILSLFSGGSVTGLNTEGESEETLINYKVLIVN